MHMAQWVLGITGGIAAYKSPNLVRLMKQQGWDVRVILSASAQSFVTPLTLQAVSGEPVHTHLLDTDAEAGMGHIQLARWATGIIIAPLSANRLAALALGMADDLLTTVCLATRAPIFVAPAMNRQMWEHPMTQQHIATCRQRNIHVIGPEAGEQACGEVGMGRMSEPEVIFQTLQAAQNPTNYPLRGKTVLITAGPTQEYFDPVRYMSNRSSGKMGFALATVAAQLGAKVILVTGPVHLPTPPHVTRLDVVSAREMHHCVLESLGNVDIFIGAAAVCDFRPKEIELVKIKKKKTAPTFHFETNPDIIASVAQSPNRPFCVGFAAEIIHHNAYAREKLVRKQLDMVAVNDISQSDIGFDADENALTVITHTGSIVIPKNSKHVVAQQLLEAISEAFHATHQTENS